MHIGNKLPSVPIAYAKGVKETYETMKTLLRLLNYQQHKWKLCCDLKVVGFLIGLKSGNPHYSCFLCLWQNRNRERHYTNYKWRKRPPPRVKQFSIKHRPLVKPADIIIPPLHIQLGLVKNFLTSLRGEESMQYLKEVLFPDITSAKLDAGKFIIFHGNKVNYITFALNFYKNLSNLKYINILKCDVEKSRKLLLKCYFFVFCIGTLDGPHIRTLIKCPDFKEFLTKKQAEAWKKIVVVIKNFLGNRRSRHYKKNISEMSADLKKS